MIEGIIEKDIDNALEAFVEKEDALDEYQVAVKKEEAYRLYREFF